MFVQGRQLFGFHHGFVCDACQIIRGEKNPKMVREPFLGVLFQKKGAEPRTETQGWKTWFYLMSLHPGPNLCLARDDEPASRPIVWGPFVTLISTGRMTQVLSMQTGLWGNEP